MSKYVVDIEDLSYTYPRSEVPALNNINLKVKAGESILITGPSGAGKTTLCQCISGVIPHFFRGKMQGKVVTLGMNTFDYDLPTLCYYVGQVFQDPSSQLVCPTVEDEIAFGLENYGIAPEEIRKRVDECMMEARLAKYVDRNPHTLSGGEQQACILSSIMAMHPKIYLLDEPTSNLDPYGSEHMLELIVNLAKTENITMILVEHKIEELATKVDRMIVMNEGEIIQEGEPRKCLDIDAKRMKDIGIRPPQASLLASELRDRGIRINQIPITTEEAVETLSRSLVKKESDFFPSHENLDLARTRSVDVIIETEDLGYIYPTGSVEALKGVNLRIAQGEYIGLLGQNGSGKSTLTKHFNGILKPTTGKVFVNGIDTTNATINELAKIVGYCYQNPNHQICCTSVKEEIEFGPKNLGIPEEEREQMIARIVRELKLEDALENDPFSLSLGDKLRVTVASILAMEPQVVIVDEPTTGQDYRGGREMMELMTTLNQTGITIIVITHDMNIAAEYTERVVLMKEGRVIADGPTRQIFTKPEVLKKTFLKPPQVTRIGQSMTAYGIPPDVLTIDEMLTLL